MLLSGGYMVAMGIADPSADDVAVASYENLEQAVPYLRALAAHPGPWAFDIETYDRAAYPSRKEVAVDPFHPDFAVRGVAFATLPTEGAWAEIRGAGPDALAALADAFGSPAEKYAYNGGFDESGLVYTGIVPSVRNRSRDGMLALVALGDGSHRSAQHVFRLESAVVNVLKRPRYWDVDKSLMRELPTRVVAAGSVRDACRTLELCAALDAMAANGKYISWEGWL